MNKHTIYTIMQWIYFLMILGILWLVGVVAGLGIFSFIPANVASVILITEMFKDPDYALLHPIREWFEKFKEEVIDGWKESLTCFLILLLVIMNIMYFSQIISVYGIVIYYLNVFLLFFVLWASTTYSVIKVLYPQQGRIERLKNSILIVLAYLVEFIISTVLLGVMGLLIEKIGVIFLLYFPVVVLLVYEELVRHLLKVHSLRHFFKLS